MLVRLRRGVGLKTKRAAGWDHLTPLKDETKGVRFPPYGSGKLLFGGLLLQGLLLEGLLGGGGRGQGLRAEAEALQELEDPLVLVLELCDQVAPFPGFGGKLHRTQEFSGSTKHTGHARKEEFECVTCRSGFSSPSVVFMKSF